jgi:hypothetical protein
LALGNIGIQAQPEVEHNGRLSVHLLRVRYRIASSPEGQGKGRCRQRTAEETIDFLLPDFVVLTFCCNAVRSAFWLFPPVRPRPPLSKPHRRGSAGSAIPICRRPRGRIWRIALQARPRSADRTRSPAAVSQKREFFKCQPETIGHFALRMPKIGAWRLVANSQKPAISGPFCKYQRYYLQAPNCVAEARGFEP